MSKRNKELIKKGLISDNAIKKIDPELLKGLKDDIKIEDAKEKELSKRLDDLKSIFI